MTTAEDREKRPFLAGEEGDADSEAFAGSRHEGNGIFSHVRWPRTHRVLFILQIILLVGNFAFFSWNVSCVRKNKVSQGNSDDVQVYTPAQSSLDYKIEEMASDNPFAGEPSPEIDRAWSNLLRGGMVKLSEDELRRMNKTSIKLKDGSGYLGYLELIHMLHCVKRLYQYQYPDYYPGLEGLHAFEPGHFDHCLEVLRRGILCNADITVNTYYWKSPTEIHGNRTGIRKCTNWQRIQDWAMERAVEFEGPDMLLDTLVRE